MQSWTVMEGETVHEVVFESLDRSNRAKLKIDGTPVVVAPVKVRSGEFYYPYYVGEVEILLKADRKGAEPDRLAAAGVYLDNGEPVASDALLELRGQARAGHPLANKNKSGMGTFAAFVAFSYLNIVLFLTVDVVFPFSAIVPLETLRAFYITYRTRHDTIFLVIGVIVSAIMVSVYLLLYALSKRHAAPLWIALVLILADTAVAAWFFLTVDMGYYILDVIFHIAVVASVIGLIRTRGRMRREKLEAEMMMD